MTFINEFPGHQNMSQVPIIVMKPNKTWIGLSRVMGDTPLIISQAIELQIVYQPLHTTV